MRTFLCALVLVIGVLAGQQSYARERGGLIICTTDGAVVYGTYSGVQLQQFLTNCGYYTGPIDGIVEPGTQAAIDAFRKDRKWIAVDQKFVNALQNR